MQKRLDPQFIFIKLHFCLLLRAIAGICAVKFLIVLVIRLLRSLHRDGVTVVIVAVLLLEEAHPRGGLIKRRCQAGRVGL